VQMSCGRFAIRAALSFVAVSLASLIHAWASLLACSDGTDDAVCWAYDSGSYGGWIREAVYVLLAPVGLVVLATVVAAWLWRPQILRLATFAAIDLTVIAYFAAPAILGSP
jgi:hypothetical protein